MVYSLGFIEHFINWDQVLIKHCNLIKPGGMLLIETPNYAGLFQKILHKFLDGEGYKRHNISSMNVDKWAKLVEANGFKVLNKSYFSGWEYWVEPQKRNWIQEYFLRVLWRNKKIMQKYLNGNKRLYSPLCGIIAVKL